MDVGDRAPPFEVVAHDGTVISSRARGGRALVLYFYPMDFTPGCTKESCDFRDEMASFTASGAEVVGVSGDSLESHRAFAKSLSLPFPLVSDADGLLRRAFGVKKILGVVDERVTFVIGGDGVILGRYSSNLFPHRHVAKARGALQKL